MKSVIEEFYSCFNRLDAEGMVACYHEEVEFQDPAFGLLYGKQAKDMWRMLCSSQKGKDFKIIYSDIEEEGDTYSAHWEALYSFSQTGRKVHNVIEAEFHFKDGKIISHRDSFDLYKWSRQALGLRGLMLGWTGYFKSKLQSQTKGMLRKFVASK